LIYREWACAENFPRFAQSSSSAASPSIIGDFIQIMTNRN